MRKRILFLLLIIGLLGASSEKTYGQCPIAAGAISGSADVCRGTSGIVYSISAVADATGYDWTVPSGATITAGANTTSITVTFSSLAVSGNITVTPTAAACSSPSATNFAVAVHGSNVVSIPNNSFENVYTNNFTYGPTADVWTYLNGAGIITNGSAFGNSNVYNGTQACFLQNQNATISQNVTFAAGRYKVKFYAGQRAGYNALNQQIEISVGTTKIDTITPIGGPFVLYTSDPFSIPATGTSILSFRSLVSGDNTAFIDYITIVDEAQDIQAVVTSNSPICGSGNINFSVGTSDVLTYSWTGPSAFSSSAQNPSIIGATSANAGVYSLVLTSSLGCVSSPISVTVGVNSGGGCTFTWIGAVNTDWNTAGNWDINAVPDSTDNVIVNNTGFSPKLAQNSAVKNIQFTGGTLDLNGYTLTIKGTTVQFDQGTLTSTGATAGNIVINGTNSTATRIGASGAVNFGAGALGATTNVNLIATTGTYSNRSSTFNGTVNITIIADAGMQRWDGGNTFNGPATFTNNSSTIFQIAYVSPDTYNNKATFNNIGSGWIELAYVAGTVFNGTTYLNNTSGSCVGNMNFGGGAGSTIIFNGDLYITNTGGQIFLNSNGLCTYNGNIILSSTCGGIYFANSGGSGILANNKSITTTGGTGFTGGELYIQRFKQGTTTTGAASQILNLTGSSQLHIGGDSTSILGDNTYFYGVVDFTVPVIYLDGFTCYNTSTITQTGTASPRGQGGCVWGAPGKMSTFNNSGSGALYVAYSIKDHFKGDATFNNTGNYAILVCDGFGNSSRGNIFDGTTIFNNTPAPGSEGFIEIGYSGTATFNGDIYANNLGLADGRYISFNKGGACGYNGNIIVSSNGGGGVFFGLYGGVGRMATSKALTTVGGTGFTGGNLAILNFYQGTTTAGAATNTLTLTGSSSIQIGDDNYTTTLGDKVNFYGPVNITAPMVSMQGASYFNNSIFTQTGSSTTYNQGNVFGILGQPFTATIINTGSAMFSAAYSKPDIYYGNVSYNNNGTGSVSICKICPGTIYYGTTTFNNNPSNSGQGYPWIDFSYWGGFTTFNGPVYFNNIGSHPGAWIFFNNAGDVTFNDNVIVSSSVGAGIRIGGSGITTMAYNKSISTTGGTGFTSGTLQLLHFRQGTNDTTGAAAQNITLTDGSALVIGADSLTTLGDNTWFYGKVNFTAPYIELNGASYFNTTIITLTGGNDIYCNGGNVFGSTGVQATFNNIATGHWWFAVGGRRDHFKGNTTFNNTGTGNIVIGWNGQDHRFEGTTIFNNLCSNNFIIVLMGSGTSVTFKGPTYFNNSPVTGTGGYIKVAEPNSSLSTFNSTVYFNNTNSQGYIQVNSSGKCIFKDNIFVSSSGAAGGSGGISFGDNPDGTATLADAKTIAVGAGGYDVGYLRIQNFNQGTAAVGIAGNNFTHVLNLTGTSSLTLGANSLYLPGGNYYLSARGANEKYFKSHVSMTGINDGGGYWYYILPNGDLYELIPPYSDPGLNGNFIANVGTAAYNSGGAPLISEINVAMGINSWFYGKVNFTAPSVYFNGTTYFNTTTITKTGPDDNLCNGWNVFGGPGIQTTINQTGSGALYMAYNVKDYFLGDATFNNTGTYMMKVGFNSPGNLFNGITIFNNSTTGGSNAQISYIESSNATGIFNGPVILRNSGVAPSSCIYSNFQGSVTYNDNITISNTGARGITFGEAGGSATLANNKSISTVGGTGFSAGVLWIRQLRQGTSAVGVAGNTSSNNTLNLTGNASINIGAPYTTTLGDNSWFYGVVNITAPSVVLNGSSYFNTTTITKNGTAVDYCSGGNVFGAPGIQATINNTGAGEWFWGYTVGDNFLGNITFNNTGSERIDVGFSSAGNLFNGTTIFNNATSGGQYPHISLVQSAGAAATFNGPVFMANTGTGSSSGAFSTYEGSGIQCTYSGSAIFNGNLVVSNYGGRGIAFGENGGTVTIANDKYITTTGGTGFTGGILFLQNWTQSTGGSNAAHTLNLSSVANLTINTSSFEGNLTGTVENTTILNSSSFKRSLNITTGSITMTSCSTNVSGGTTTIIKNGMTSDRSNGGNYFGGATTITQNKATTQSLIGSIVWEYWGGVAGGAVSDIPVNSTPTSVANYSSFEGPTNFADNYGTRMRGYIHPPATGNYTFWIASDDNNELWLSTDSTPGNKVRIAYLNSWANSREWTRDPSQQSATISLVAGKKYYIEALQKEGGGGDNLAVGWQLPDGTLERPIPGNRLSPYGSGEFYWGVTNPDVFAAASTFNANSPTPFAIAYNTSGNTFGGTATFNAITSSTFFVSPTATSVATFNSNSIFNASDTAYIYVARDAGASATFNGNMTFNNSSIHGIYFGDSGAGGTTSLSSGSVSSPTFAKGTLSITNFTQLGATSQNLTLTGTGNLIVGPSSEFDGSVSFTSPELHLNGCTYNGSSSAFVKNGSTNDNSDGNNIFNSVSTITNTGTGNVTLAAVTRDLYKKNITFVKSSSGVLSPAYNGQNEFEDDVTCNGDLVFNGGTGVCYFTNTNQQDIYGTVSPTFPRMTVNKSSNKVNLNLNISVSIDLSLINGYIDLNTKKLTMSANTATVNGASRGGVALISSAGAAITARGENGAGEGMLKAFDSDPNTKWLDFAGTSWIELQYSGSNKKTVSQYSLTSANDADERDPLNWTLSGSNDGSAWTVIDTRTGEDFATRLLKRTFTISIPGAYNYYKFDMTNNSGGIIQLADIEFLGQDTDLSNGTTYNGYVLSENVNNTSEMAWVIGNQNRTYLYPFGNSSATLVPFELQLTDGGAIGTVTVSTYPTPLADNLPLPVTPQTVTNLRGGRRADDSDFTADRFWQLTRTGTDGTATLTFTYADIDIDLQSITESALKAQRYEKTTDVWQNSDSCGLNGSPVVHSINTVTNRVSVAGVKRFSPWTLASDDSPLPVDFLSVEAKEVQTGVVDVSWKTAREVNCDYYDVERSTDGKKFLSLGKTVKAENKSIYKAEDPAAVTGANYYRVKMVEFGGKSVYSPIRNIMVEGSEDAFNIYPNPATANNFNVSLKDGIVKEEVLVVLYNALGQEVYSKILINEEGNMLTAVNLGEDITPGVYLVVGTTNNSIYKRKILIK